MLVSNATMTWDDFHIGFWHPFGPHGRETREQILQRKAREVQANGWTLWSFQHRKQETLHQWLQAIEAEQVSHAFVLCSDSRGAVDPSGETDHIREYRPADGTQWLPVPAQISVPHPGKSVASGFKVKQVLPAQSLFGQPDFLIEWLDMSGNWRSDALPTRGEYLVRRGGTCRLRSVFTLLELKHPYVASLRK